MVVGALFWLGSQDIRRTGASQANDPGPRVFPAALAATLLVAGAAYGAWGLASLVQRRSAEPRAARTTTADYRLRAVIAAAAMIGYVAVMPIAGFSLSTFAFATGMLVALGAGLVRAACVSAALVGLIQLLFRQLFHVILPGINLMNLPGNW